MEIPLEVSFRGVRKTDAIEDLIREKAAKLEKICDYMTRCRVAVESPHEHQQSGQVFRVRIEMHVPPGHELVATREPGEGDIHRELPTVVRDAFEAASRQLKRLVEQQRKEIKRHPEQETTAFVDKIFKEEGYGFLHSVDGREIYFH